MTCFCNLNLKCLPILSISEIISSLNCMLSLAENEQSFMTSGPEFCLKKKNSVGPRNLKN